MTRFGAACDDVPSDMFWLDTSQPEWEHRWKYCTGGGAFSGFCSRLSALTLPVAVRKRVAIPEDAKYDLI